MLTYTEISNNKVKTDILIGIFIAVIIVIGYVFSVIYGSYAIMVIAILFSTITALFSYYNSDKIALSASKATKVDRATNQELYRVVENLAIAGGLPTPEIYIINDPAMNAFATGRDPKHAVVCVTSGLLANMNREELEGVIAHELSHVGNYDIRLSTIVVVLAGSLALISSFFLRSSMFGFTPRRGNNNGNNGIFLIVGLLLAILAPISATLIQLAISRKREFLADASGALLSRYPEGLASALEKIRDADMPVREANTATAHLYFTNPLKGENTRGGKHPSVFAGLFDTHPDINERIRRLRGMDMPGNQ
jgi:heat shock protein HtpX